MGNLKIRFNFYTSLLILLAYNYLITQWGSHFIYEFTYKKNSNYYPIYAIFLILISLLLKKIIIKKKIFLKIAVPNKRIYDRAAQIS
jgi:membrane protease YdiL (CAAX protease family)